jgi:methyl-accepting chemotaxis protein
MKNLKIGPKLIASFLFLAAMTAFMGIYLTSNIKSLDKQADILYQQGAIPLGMLVKTAKQAQEMHINIWKWQLAKTDESRAATIRAIDDSHTLVRELIGRQRELVLAEAEIKILDNLQSAIDKFVEETHNYAIKAKIDPITGIVEDIYPTVPKAVDEMLKTLDVIIDRRVNSTKILSDEASKLTDNSKDVTIMLLVITLFLSVGLGIFLTISITHPLNTVVDTLSKMEKGDMTIRADLKREDELGMLSRALDGLSARFQTIFRKLLQDSNTLASSAAELSSIGKQVAKESIYGADQINQSADKLVKLSGNLKNILRQFKI